MFLVTVLPAKILFTLFFTPAYLKSLSTGWMSTLENHKKRRELMCSCFPCSSLRESFSKQQTNFSCIKQSIRVCWYVFQLILCPSFTESAEHCLNNLPIHAVNFPTQESLWNNTYCTNPVNSVKEAVDTIITWQYCMTAFLGLNRLIKLYLCDPFQGETGFAGFPGQPGYPGIQVKSDHTFTPLSPLCQYFLQNVPTCQVISLYTVITSLKVYYYHGSYSYSSPW